MVFILSIDIMFLRFAAYQLKSAQMCRILKILHKFCMQFQRKSGKLSIVNALFPIPICQDLVSIDDKTGAQMLARPNVFYANKKCTCNCSWRNLDFKNYIWDFFWFSRKYFFSTKIFLLRKNFLVLIAQKNFLTSPNVSIHKKNIFVGKKDE